ncbi:MAG: hypothetical protein ACFB9M_01450 [Myxococcota bacterium]
MAALMVSASAFGQTYIYEPASEPKNFTGPVLRLYGTGLVGYYGEAFYRTQSESVIPELAFGVGGLIGAEFGSRFMIGAFGEVLFGGLDTDPFAGIEGFSEPSSRRYTFGLSARLTLTGNQGIRPYIGVDGQLMRQLVDFTSETGRLVPVRSRVSGRVIGFASVPDGEITARHWGKAVGPVVGLRWKLTRPGEPHVDLFVEGAVVYEWWDDRGTDGFTFGDVEAAQATADLIETFQRSPEAWSGTVRVGLQFGP